MVKVELKFLDIGRLKSLKIKFHRYPYRTHPYRTIEQSMVLRKKEYV